MNASTPLGSVRRGALRRSTPVLVCALVAALASLLTARAQGAAGPEVNVSSLPGAQNEPTIAVDPTNPEILVAGSNSRGEGTMRVYGSTDGGLTWTVGTVYPRPVDRRKTCAADPGVAIDLAGRQYYSFLRLTPCGGDRPRLFVASRADPAAPWSRPALVAPLGRARLDDKPAIAVDVSPTSRFANRVYVAWTRVARNGAFAIVLSHSDDAGRSWSRPVKVSGPGRLVSYASVAVARDGTVYVAWDDMENFWVRIARSTDGGERFEPGRKAASFSIVQIPHCGSGIVIPAQRLTCARPNPIVSVDRSSGPYSGRVYVTYARTEFYGNQGAFVTVFDSALSLLSASDGRYEGPPVAPPPPGQRTDQFWPQSAVDPATGAVWVCFYDTRDDPERKRVFYSCTVSRDGGQTWAQALPAASVPSDETQPGADPREFGDYQGLAVAGGVAHPIWTDSRNLATLAEEIYTTRLTEAELSPPPGG